MGAKAILGRGNDAASTRIMRRRTNPPCERGFRAVAIAALARRRQPRPCGQQKRFAACPHSGGLSPNGWGPGIGRTPEKSGQDAPLTEHTHNPGPTGFTDRLHGAQLWKQIGDIGVNEIITAPQRPRHNACGTGDWQHTPRVPGRYDRAQRSRPQTGSAKLIRPLPRLAHSFLARHELSGALSPAAPNCGDVTEVAEVGGLHYHYERRTA